LIQSIFIHQELQKAARTEPLGLALSLSVLISLNEQNPGAEELVFLFGAPWAFGGES
jgi:hypothetical protein